MNGRKYIKAKSVYIAGPMRGYERFNFDAFAAAANYLRSIGLEVFSPHEGDLAIGFDPNKTLIENKFNFEDAVRRDVEMIIKANGVVFLPGWQKSTGAQAEKAIARWLGKTCYTYPDLAVIKWV